MYTRPLISRGAAHSSPLTVKYHRLPGICSQTSRRCTFIEGSVREVLGKHSCKKVTIKRKKLETKLRNIILLQFPINVISKDLQTSHLPWSGRDLCCHSSLSMRTLSSSYRTSHLEFQEVHLFHPLAAPFDLEGPERQGSPMAPFFPLIEGVPGGPWGPIFLGLPWSLLAPSRPSRPTRPGTLGDPGLPCIPGDPDLPGIPGIQP